MKPAIVRIAEREPEVVIPLSRMGRYGGGLTVNVAVTGNHIMDDQTADRLAAQVGDKIVRKIRQNYQVGFTGTRFAR